MTDSQTPEEVPTYTTPPDPKPESAMEYQTHFPVYILSTPQQQTMYNTAKEALKDAAELLRLGWDIRIEIRYATLQ